MREQGAGPAQAVMTDNAFAYVHSHAFGSVLDELGARQIRTPPYTPRWNGKVERFIQTLDDERAHGRVWPTSTQRDGGPASWLRFYNRRRPHTSLGDRPPISRVHQDRGLRRAGFDGDRVCRFAVFFLDHGLLVRAAKRRDSHRLS